MILGFDVYIQIKFMLHFMMNAGEFQYMMTSKSFIYNFLIIILI